MKPLLFLFAAFALFCSTPAPAQRLVRYQGEIQGGYSFSCDGSGMGFVTIHMLNGIGVGKYFSAAIGVGVDVEAELFSMSALLPLFANVKGYLPVGRKTSAFVSLDMGGSFLLSGYGSGYLGLLYTPAAGFAFDVGKKGRALLLSLGYHVQCYSGADYWDENLQMLSIRLGYRF